MVERGTACVGWGGMGPGPAVDATPALDRGPAMCAGAELGLDTTLSATLSNSQSVSYQLRSDAL